MLHTGDCRLILPELAKQGVRVQTCITSPPYYGLRDYGYPDQIGLESSVSEYVDNLVSVFRLVRDVLSDDGTLWLNLGDSYKTSSGTKPTPCPNPLPTAASVPTNTYSCCQNGHTIILTMKQSGNRRTATTDPVQAGSTIFAEAAANTHGNLIPDKA